jgi:hypothetical protein
MLMLKIFEFWEKKNWIRFWIVIMNQRDIMKFDADDNWTKKLRICSSKFQHIYFEGRLNEI